MPCARLCFFKLRHRVTGFGMQMFCEPFYACLTVAVSSQLLPLVQLNNDAAVTGSLCEHFGLPVCVDTLLDTNPVSRAGR